MIYLSERRCTVRNILLKCIRIFVTSRPRIIFNIFPVSSYCPCFFMEQSYLSQSLIGRFCPCLLLVGSVSVSYWSVSVPVSYWSVSVPVSYWSVLSQSLIGWFCPRLLLVGSVPVSYWSVLSQSLIGRLCSPPLIGRFLPATS